MPNVTLLPQGRQRYYDNNGIPLAGGKLYTYAAGTTTPKSTYADADGTAFQTNPVILDAKGEAVIFWDGAYKVNLTASDDTQITGWPLDNIRTDPLNLQGGLAGLTAAFNAFVASLAGDIGSTLVGFLQAGVGAVRRTWQKKGEDTVNGAEFGMVADYATTKTNNAPMLQKLLDAMKLRGGGTCTINPGDYFLGSYATSQQITTIANLSNTKFNCHGARFIVNTTADDTTPFMMVFDSPNNVSIHGLKFFDEGFNPASWQTHSRWGAGGVLLKATSVSKGFTMQDCDVTNATYLLVADLRATKRNLSNITVRDCTAQNAYYGVDVLYVGDNLVVENLRCTDVRRGVIGYGMRNFDLDVKLYTNSGFLGSNAFISITCEGETYNDGNGVLGQEGNVRNGRVKLKVSGFEAHSAYVHFYHQQADSTGDITGIDCDVQINNLSSAGKNVLIGPTNMYLIDHELPNSSVIGATTRQCKQLQLDGSIRGTITGVPIQVDSINNASPHTLELSPNLTALAQTYTVNGFTVSDFISPFDKPLTSLNPIGGTVPGVPTGLTSVGSWTQVGKRVFFSARLSWTAHTGTGQLRLDGLPKPLDTTRGTLAVSAVAGFGLSHTAGTALIGLLGGTGGQQILFYEDNAGAVSTVPVDGTVSDLMVSGSYPTP